MKDRQLRIFLVVLHLGYVRNYEGALRILLSRGHRIHIGTLNPSKIHGDRVAERLAEEFANLTVAPTNRPERSGWRNVRWTVRLMSDFARYLHPRYADADALRDRVAEKVELSRRVIGPLLAFYVTLYLLAFKRVRNAWVSDRLVGLLSWIDGALSTSKKVDRAISDFAPDMVLATPVVAVGRFEQDYLRSAIKLGLRTGALVASWDNLTNKGLMRAVPDRVLVWNDVQRREAVEMHRQPADRVVATGAQRFDSLFEQRPTFTREKFCEAIGLDRDKQYLLYLCSSPFIAPNEVKFVHRFVDTVRKSTGPLRDVGILIRPHPQNAVQWQDAVIDAPNVVIHPRGGEQPIEGLARASYYDSIFHSSAVVGINTSAQIEAGILDKTVHTVRDPEFAGVQEGTLHFHYLLAENGGLLYVSDSMPELIETLERAVRGELDPDQTRKFIDSFVRPRGRNLAASPFVAEEIEAIADLPEPARARFSVGKRIVRLSLAPVAFLSRPQLVTPGLSALVLQFWGRVAVLRDRLSPRKAEPVPDDFKGIDRRRVRSAVKAAHKSNEPIVAGPWLHDLASEVLYWIPFLTWVTQHNDLPRSRLIVASRGGVASWYRHVAGRYVEAFDVISVDDYLSAEAPIDDRRWRGAHGLSAEIANAISADLGSRLGRLEPAILRDPIRRFRQERCSFRHIEWFLDRRPLLRPSDDELRDLLPEHDALAEEFVAFHLAFSPVFPDIPRNRELIQRLLEAMQRENRVVMIGPLVGDPPRTWQPPTSNQVLFTAGDGEPARSLYEATIAITRSRGLVTTDPQLSTVAAAHGVDALVLYSELERLPHADLAMAERLAHITSAQLTVADALQLNILSDLTPRADTPSIDGLARAAIGS